MGNVHHSLFGRGQVAIGDQVPVDVGARLVGRVARRGVCPIAEPGVEEGKSVGNVVAMQMHCRHSGSTYGMAEMTAVQGQHRGRSRRHSQPLDADVLGLAYGVAKVVHALDLDQRSVVHIAVLVFAIAATKSASNEGPPSAGVTWTSSPAMLPTIVRKASPGPSQRLSNSSFSTSASMSGCKVAIRCRE